MQRHKLTIVLAFFLGVSLNAVLSAEDYYVSATNGKGKKATKEQPAKDLGNIISKLKPGDVVHLAGGTYTGRGDCGTNIITVPVSIIGGYDESFSNRDPWGEYKTIFSGVNKSDNWKREPALMIDLMKYREKEMPEIVVDGIIVDHGDRNRYATEANLEIVRSANPKTKENPTPDQGGLVIRVSKVLSDDVWRITVQNCIVMNTAGSQGALAVSGYEGSEITIRNNLVINNTGAGIVAGTKFRGRDDTGKPQFDIRNNTVMFTWKFDPAAQSYSGNSLQADPDVVINASNNVFAFADRYGVHNAGRSSILLTENLILGNVLADYLEFDTNMNLDEMVDEAEFIHEDTDGNVAEKFEVPISTDWAEHYGSRVLIDRNAVEADIKVQMTRANELRSILGLPLQAGQIDGPESPVWLNRLSIDDAVATGANRVLGQFGCEMPEGN